MSGKPRLELTDGLLWWRPTRPVLAVATAIIGGGLGVRCWWANGTVPARYDHQDPVADLRHRVLAAGLDGDGVAMMTAVDVARREVATDGGAWAVTTVGVGWPTYAADVDGAENPNGPGTINLLVWVPVRLSDAALVNAATTATEAKVQALAEHRVPGTGTASDAVAVMCPLDGPVEAYGGPRSTWGARLARAVHAAVGAGLATDERDALALGYRRTKATP
jgi:adenosylcobinamide hydrolase